MSPNAYPSSKVTFAALGAAAGEAVVQLVELVVEWDIPSKVEGLIVLACVFAAGYWKSEKRPTVSVVSWSDGAPETSGHFEV